MFCFMVFGGQGEFAGRREAEEQRHIHPGGTLSSSVWTAHSACATLTHHERPAVLQLPWRQQ